MNKILNYLSRNRIVNAVILIIYYIAVVLPHEFVGKNLNKLAQITDRASYNLVILILTIAIAVFLICVFYRRWRGHPHKGPIAFFTIISLLLVALSFHFFFVINIEMIHFIQYAIFAILAFPLMKNSISVLVLSTAAGILDELYQYLFLSIHWNNYYDFNDVVIDIIGAGIGIIIVKLYHWDEARINLKILLKRFEFHFLAGIILIFLIGLLTGHFEIYSSENSSAVFALVHTPATGFWTIPPGPPAKFHILRPLEGLIVIIILLAFYFRLNKIQG